MSIVKKVVSSKNPSKEELPKPSFNSIIPSFSSTYPPLLKPLNPIPLPLTMRPHNLPLFKLKDGNNFLRFSRLRLVLSLEKIIFLRKLYQLSRIRNQDLQLIIFTLRIILMFLRCRKSPIIIRIMR